MRDFINKKEGKLTVLRLLGFYMMIAGVLALIIGSFFTGEIIPNIVAIAFFITMLGFSMAFPSLLKGSEGLSTMRIIVFMITNVVCMLLLKIGWASGITSLSQIGIDEYWVGIIAFTFGAKAVQSFFENRTTKIVQQKTDLPVGMAALEYSSAEIAKMAVLQNEQYLKVKFPNILSVSDAVDGIGEVYTHIIAIYLKDNNIAGIPHLLEVKMPDGRLKTIATEIIEDNGNPKIQYSQLNSTLTYNDDNGSSTGSICCGVRSSVNPNFKGIVTSAHVCTGGWYKNSFNSMLNAAERTEILLNNVKSGYWYYKVLTDSQDLAVAVFDDNQQEDPNYMSFNNKFYKVEDKDVTTTMTNITMLSKDNKSVNAFIIDYNIGMDVNYRNGAFYKRNLILVGTTNDRKTAKPISISGDSGSCVYHSETKQLIGMLLGRAKNFSLVLPIEETLNSYNLITI